MTPTLPILKSLCAILALLTPMASAMGIDPSPGFDASIDDAQSGVCNGRIDLQCYCRDGTQFCLEGEPCGVYVDAGQGMCIIGEVAASPASAGSSIPAGAGSGSNYCNGVYDTNCVCRDGVLYCEEGDPCNIYVFVAAQGICVVGPADEAALISASLSDVGLQGPPEIVLPGSSAAHACSGVVDYDCTLAGNRCALYVGSASRSCL